MEKLEVIAGFDWLEKEEKIGTLGHESLRGSDVFSFEFDKNWLNRHSDIILGRDLQPFTGIQYSPVGNRVFGCFSDALPDRWGRRLIDLRAAQDAGLSRREVSYFSERFEKGLSFQYSSGLRL